jgi:hypothetical protein
MVYYCLKRTQHNAFFADGVVSESFLGSLATKLDGINGIKGTPDEVAQVIRLMLLDRHTQVQDLDDFCQWAAAQANRRKLMTTRRRQPAVHAVK